MNSVSRVIMKGVGRLLGGILGGVRTENVKVVPRTGPLLVVANHLSNVDPPVIFTALPRRAWFMAKKDLFNIRILGPFIRWIGAFPVRQDAADRSAIRFTEERLKAGDAVVIFPEGHLSETGQMECFQPGAAMIALRAGATVLPVGLIGTQEMLPYGRLFPQRASRPAQIRFGPPFSLDDLQNWPRQEAIAEATRRMEIAVAGLAEQPVPVHGEGYDKEGAGRR